MTGGRWSDRLATLMSHQDLFRCSYGISFVGVPNVIDRRYPNYGMSSGNTGMKKRRITVKISSIRRMSSASRSPIQTAVRFLVCNQLLDTLIVPIKRKPSGGWSPNGRKQIGADLDRCSVGPSAIGRACWRLPCIRGGRE